MRARFPLVPAPSQNLDETVSSRRSLQFTLAVVLLVALCVFVPGFLYFTEMALRELRFMWWLILLLGGTLWLLTRLGRKR